VPGRIDELQLVDDSVMRLVFEPYRLRLDGDATLALELELVEELRDLLAFGDRAGQVEDAVASVLLP